MAGYRGYNRPTLQEIRERVYSDINNQLPGMDARLRFTPLNALAEAVIGATYEMYGYIDWSARQTNVLDCEDENLDKYGNIWGVVRKQASFTTGTVTITGLNTSEVPAGTVLQSSNELLFETDSLVTIGVSGSATVNVSALSPGKDYNLSTSTQLFFVNTLSGVDQTATVISLTGGADIESDTAFRSRVLERISYAPHGGSKQDYITWALEVSGVTRAWAVSEELGPGTVSVRFMMDDTYADGIPLAGDVTTVQNYISDDSRKPITAQVTVVAPVASALNITVTGLVPNDAQTQANVTAEIENMIKQKAEPGGVIRISWIWEAVSLATGTQYHTITVPTADVTYGTGVIPIPGTITFA